VGIAQIIGDFINAIDSQRSCPMVAFV